MNFGTVTSRGILLSTREFKSLKEYSCSLPTGTYIGKRWRRRVPYGERPDAEPEWFMGEYVESLIPGEIGIEWTRIILFQALSPEPEDKPNAS